MQIDYAGSWRRGSDDDRDADEEHGGEREESDLQERLSVLFVQNGRTSFRFDSRRISHESRILGIFDRV